MKNIISLSLAFCLLSIISLAQNTTLIKGTVIDSKTGQPVPYANLGIEGTFIGSASNMDGYFEFKVPSGELDGLFFASAVGYKTIRMEIAEAIAPQNLVVKMRQQSYDIDEVDISAQSLVLFRIVRDAGRRIEKNYLQGPLSMKAYYRNREVTNGNLIKQREAAVEITDQTGYRHETPYQEQLHRNYRFMEVKKNFTVEKLADGMTYMDDLLSFDIARTKGNILDEAYLKKYDLSLDQVIEYEGDSVWVINYTLNEPNLASTGDYYATSYNGKLYVNKHDFAVIKNETWIKSKNYNPHGRSLAVASSDRKPVSINYKFTTTYKKVNGKYTLAFIKATRDNNWKLKSGESMTTTGESYLLPTETKPNAAKMLKEREYFADKPYNETFWKNFNFIVE